jgi:hypothetical protein
VLLRYDPSGYCIATSAWLTRSGSRPQDALKIVAQNAAEATEKQALARAKTVLSVRPP